MSRRYVNQLTHGDSIDEVFLVADKQLRANRQGNLYLQLELRDKTGSIGARLWNATEDLSRTFEPGDYLRIRGKTQVFQGSLQIILTHIDAIDGSRVEPEEFLPQSSQNVGKLMARLREVLLAMRNPHLRALVECFLIDDEFLRKFTLAPAGIKNHHAYQGGLVEHVVTLLNVADRITAVLPRGRPRLAPDRHLPPRHRQDRRAVLRPVVRLHRRGPARGAPGHGRGDARGEGPTQCNELMGEPFPPELLLRLKHMIVSHHGTYEFGSPKLPMTLEAMALHLLDNLDAKIHAYTPRDPRRSQPRLELDAVPAEPGPPAVQGERAAGRAGGRRRRSSEARVAGPGDRSAPR